MIQAYRRGLLKPNHPFGQRSRLRETVLLESIEMENLELAVSRQISTSSSLLTGAQLQPEARRRLMKDYSQDLYYYHLVKYMDYDRAEKYKFENSALALTAVYEILQHAGVLPE